MNSTKIAKIEQAVYDVWSNAMDIYGGDLPAINIEYYKRGYAAGKAKVNRLYQEYTVMFNLNAIDNYFDEMIAEVVPHELAHLVCFAKPELGKNHDKGWKRVCKRLGGTGERCHTFDLEPARKINKFVYVATCGTKVELGKIRHNKVQKGQVYRVRNGGKITRDGWQR